MKKQFLILFAFISVLTLSQVPQRFNKVIVTGDITSPKFIKTGSTVDSVLLGNGSARSVNSFKTDTTSLSNRINLKEPLLPSTPSNPESRFLNGNKQWAEIVLGSGGYASNVYFTNLTSTIVGSYKQTSGTHELTETIASGTCNNNEVLIHTYLFEQPVGITTVDAGVWRFTMNSKISSNVGDSKFKIVQFRRSSTGVETDMFTIYSNTIENTDYQNFIIETVQPSFLVDSLDRFGCRIYATTTTTVNKTISYKVGDGFASYLNTPLVPRHDQFRALNGNPNVQHLTAAQVTKVNNTSGINTGDETLTSIKTKLGAASAVSDGYLRYQDFALLHAPTTVTASNGLSISGQNISLQDASLTQSGALTFNDYNKFDSKEPAITKNSGFNLPLGNTPGTVLEGRTFGTAANSAVGDFVQNQNSVNQNANIWIKTGKFTSGTSSASIITVGSASDVGKLQFGDLDTKYRIYGGAGYGGLGIAVNDIDALLFNTSGAATFASTVQATQLQSTVATGTAPLTVNSTTMVSNLNADLLDGNHASAFQPVITGLSTNYITKWNGSSFINSAFRNDNTNSFIDLKTTITGVSGYDVLTLNKQAGSANISFYNDGTYGGQLDCAGGIMNLYSNSVKVQSSSPSTLPTTGALVVNGGVGADHVRANNFYGSGSNLTGVQLPITLTTNGTSGAATFSGNVLNVPNYADGNIGINQTQTVINGSGGGSMTCSELFNGVAYKKVLITVVGLSGTATYTFPNSFSAGRFYTTFVTGISGYTVTNSSFSFTSGAGTTGCIIIEGY